MDEQSNQSTNHSIAPKKVQGFDLKRAYAALIEGYIEHTISTTEENEQKQLEEQP